MTRRPFGHRLGVRPAGAAARGRRRRSGRSPSLPRRSGRWCWWGRSSATPAICPGSTTLEGALGVPVIPMESPRGLNDARLGAFAEVLRQADLIVLLGKALDFTLRFGDPPVVDPACRFIAIDPEAEMIERIAREKGERLAYSVVADAVPAMPSADRARATPRPSIVRWTARGARRGRLSARRPGRRSPRRSRARSIPWSFAAPLQAVLATRPNAVLVCDGGEIGQWPQACSRRRGASSTAPPARSAPSIPFAIAARARRTRRRRSSP